MANQKKLATLAHIFIGRPRLLRGIAAFVVGLTALWFAQVVMFIANLPLWFPPLIMLAVGLSVYFGYRPETGVKARRAFVSEHGWAEDPPGSADLTDRFQRAGTQPPPYGGTASRRAHRIGGKWQGREAESCIYLSGGGDPPELGIYRVEAVRMRASVPTVVLSSPTLPDVARVQAPTVELPVRRRGFTDRWLVHAADSATAALVVTPFVVDALARTTRLAENDQDLVSVTIVDDLVTCWMPVDNTKLAGCAERLHFLVDVAEAIEYSQLDT